MCQNLLCLFREPLFRKEFKKTFFPNLLPEIAGRKLVMFKYCVQGVSRLNLNCLQIFKIHRLPHLP